MTNTAPDDRRALLQSALQAIDDLQVQLDDAGAAARQPIAVVGLSCRFPGGATSPERYWELLRAGRDVVTEYPAERRALVEGSGADFDSCDDGRTWYGGFLDDIDRFDAQVFGISPREAATMDPQQRLVLEVSWEALERSGIAPDSLSGTATGVFLGITGTEYVQLAKLGGADRIDVYSATGGALNAAAGRIAFTLGLQGPCMAIDTACSSSLVALHQACQSLRTGESNLALAGGVNLLLLPEGFVCFNQWGMMAPDGRCKTFDAAADGFVRGEGCGILVLKRLRDAVADGDRVLAVIRGSAVNQDGRSSGLTVPNGLAQQAVLRQALANAGVAPAEVQYFEAHGTGTALGDPIEIEAMGAVLGRERTADQPLIVGSVKTNLGHLESASGIAGVIKVVLAMQHGEIPPHLHFHEPSPKIPWPPFPLVVPTEPTPWPATDGHRLAGVSGFGFSGTNAHVVIESPPPDVTDGPVDGDSARIVTLSARTEGALRQQAADLAGWIEAHPELSLADVSATANQGRAQLSHRLAVTATSLASLVERLRAAAIGDAPTGVITGRARRPRLAFLYTGQGAQHLGMARGLYEAEPVFRAALDRCAGLMDPLLGRPLLSVLFAEPGTPDAALLDQTGYTQPALFAVEHALSALWHSWGVVPDAVLGHSVGEIVAATVAGVFSLEDAVRLVVARGALMQALPSGGAMAAIFAPHDDVAAAVAGRSGIAVAAVNGPAHTVVSGDADAVAVVTSAFTARGVRVQALTVSHAFHSPLMEPVLDELRRVASSISYRPAQRRLASNVTGALAGAEVASAEYWVRHVMAPVRFADGVATLRDAGIDTFVEIGPHTVLTAMGQACVPDEDVTWVASLRRNRPDREQLFGALGALFTVGVKVDWSAVHADGRRCLLPTYPFQRQRHWLEPVSRSRRPLAGGHPLAGPAVPVPLLGATLHEAVVAADSPAWLADHRLAGTIVFPATAYAELVLAAIEPGGEEIESMAILEPLVVPEDGEITLQVVATPLDGAVREVRIARLGSGRPADGHTVHARAAVRRRVDGPIEGSPLELSEAAIAAAYPITIDVDEYYERLRDAGLTYGPTFQGLRRLVRRDGAALGFAELPAEAAEGGRYHLHPALFDASFHVLGAALAMLDPATADGGILVPVALEGVRLYRSGATAVWCQVTVLVDAAAGATIAATLRLFDGEGKPVATVDRLEVRRTSRAMWQRLAARREPVYELAWRPAPSSAPVAAPRRWLVVGDAGVRADAEHLAAELVARGASSTVISGADATSSVAALAAAVDGAQGSLGVVYVGGLAHPETGDATVERELGGALGVVQMLAERPLTDTRLWLVTRGAQSVAGEPAAVAGATLWGFGRVVANEQRQLACTCIDIEPAAVHAIADLADELLLGDGEDQIAHRGRQRFVARLARLDLDRTVVQAGAGGEPVAHDAGIGEDGGYLVTGGLGGIGVTLAAGLVARGARDITLAGRKAPTAEAWAAIAELEAAGATVRVAQADVTDPADVERLVADAGQRRPLRGVFHLAGTTDDGALAQQTWARFAGVLGPKITGAALLDQATRPLDLDHFVLFSSASGLLGNPGQSAYAAANRGLDAVAAGRRAAGYPGLSIDWGAWADTGMAARLDERQRQRLAGRGVGTIEPAAALALMDRLLAQDRAAVAVLEMDWAAALEPFDRLPPLLVELAPAGRADGRPAGDVPPPNSLVDALAAAAPDDRRGLTVAHVEDQLGRVLGLRPGAGVDPDQDLTDLGMDSLTAVELTNRLRSSTGLALESTLVFEQPSVNALAGHLVEQLDRVVAVKARIAAMSPEEVARALASRRARGDEGSG